MIPDELFQGSVIAGITFYVIQQILRYMFSRSKLDTELDTKQTQNQHEVNTLIINQFSSSVDKLADRLDRLITSNDETNRINSARIANVEIELRTLTNSINRLIDPINRLIATQETSDKS